jgi:putative ABC transport system permease protein
LDTLIQDLRFAIRTLRRSPGLAVLAVLCMGLGIGAVSSMYSTAVVFTFRPLPYVRDAGRLMHVWESPASDPTRHDAVSAGALRDLRTLRVFGAVTAMRLWSANITGIDLPERVRAARISANSVHAFGRRPLLGRDFTEADDEFGAGRVALLGYGLWQRRFGGDSGIVGRVVRVNGEGYTVIGVMPEDFVFPAGVQLWAPLALSPDEWANRRDRSVFVLARLAPGVDARQAEADVEALGARLAGAYPATSADWVMRAEPAERYFGAGPRPFMVVLLAAGAFVLLIACANVANLLLARATARRRELAVRVALGASRARIIRQQLTESLLIALAGGGLGVLLALWSLSALGTSVPVEVRAYIPGFGELHLSAQALVVTVLVSVTSGILFGLAPAFAAARVDVQGSLKEGARGEVGGAHTGRLRSSLVVAEVALALVLLVGAAQMLTTFRRLALGDPGFRADGILTMSVTLPAADYPADSNVVQFYRTLEDRVAELPGVAAVGATTILPLSWGEYTAGVQIPGREYEHDVDAPRVGVRFVSPGYLGAVGIPLVRGRAFTADDKTGAPLVAVVSDGAARLLWPGDNPLGKQFHMLSDTTFEVVGVAGNVRGNPLTGLDTRLVVYVPERQLPARTMRLVVRASGDVTRLARLVQGEIGRLDSRLAAGEILPMRRVIASAISPQSATAQTLAVAALVALLMACVGIYGVMAYSVAQRTQEIGVRVALGATGGGIVRLVLGRAAVLAVGGVVIGIVGAVAMSSALQAILVDTKANDPVAIGGVAVILAAVSLLASWVPALRATRVDPMEALRSE